MPSTVTGGTNDGTCKGALTSFASARNHAGFAVSDLTLTRDANALKYTYFSRRGKYQFFRVFFEFDTSGITIAPTEATLNIRGHANDALDVIVVRSEHSATLAASDFHDGLPSSTFSALTNSAGDGSGTFAGINGLTYSAEFSSWDASGVNEIPLIAPAFADIASLDTFKVCVMEYDHDYLDVDGGSTASTGMYFADLGDPASFLPSLVYEPGTAAVADNATFFGANF